MELKIVADPLTFTLAFAQNVKQSPGRRVMYIRCRLFKPMSELTELYDKYFAFMIDQCDKRSKSTGFSMMYDVTDAGLSNVEMVG